MRMKIQIQAFDWLLFFLLSFAVLWKGGKALDATWMLALVSSAITIGTALFIPQSKRQTPPLLPCLIALAFVIWSVLSFTHSTTNNVGFDEILQTTSLFLLFTYALSVADSRLQVFSSRFARIISAAALVACGIGFVVYALQPVSRFVGTFFDYRFQTDYWPNAWAEFVLFAWPLMIWSLWCRKSENKLTRLNILVMSMPIACLFLSYSRGAMLAMLTQLVLLSVWLLMHARQNLDLKRIFRSAVLVAFSAVLLFVVANHVRSQFNDVESVVKKATFTASEGTSSVSERSQFWRQAIALTKEKPLFGFGPYSFRYVQPRLQTDVLATSDHPHNVFLKFAAERGVPAAFLFLIILAYCIGTSLFGSRTMHQNRDPLLTALLLTSILGVLLHNLIDYNLQFVAIAAPFWIALGLLSKRASEHSSSRLTHGVTGVTAGIAVVLLFFAMQEGRFLWLSSSARHSEIAGNFPDALSSYAKTDASLFPRDAWLSRSMMLISSGTSEEAQGVIDRAISFNAEDYRIWKLQGDLFLKQDKFADAQFAFEKAYAYGKYNDLGITRVLIELLKKHSKELDARRHEFERLLNDFGLAIGNNVHFIDLSSNVEELVKICTLLKSAYPSEGSVYDSLAGRALRHATQERVKISSRPRGLLW